MVVRFQFQVIGEDEAARELGKWSTSLRNPRPAFEDMMDYLAAEQKDWFATKGEGSWPQLSEPYRTWKKKRFPKRGILHGPDTRGHRGLQLRDQLTKRPFGIERVAGNSFTIGTDLPYADAHQKGEGRLPVRKPLKPLSPAMISALENILKTHIVGEIIGRNMR